MAGKSMEVDTARLQTGAGRCGDAAGTALAASGRLAEKPPPSAMFGDFAEAHSFHAVLSAAHRSHVDQLQAHHRVLTGIGDKTCSGADRFTAADASAADALTVAGTGFEAP